MLEDIVFETWPSDRDGLRATRDFVCTGADGREIARGTSAWLVLDVARRRATRLPEAIEAFGPPERPRALTFDGAPPEPDGALLAEQTFPVRRSDLDRVGHANNVRFVEWALEAVPDPWIGGRTLLNVDITYAAEAVRGDAVRSAATVVSPTVLAHHLTREGDGRLLARATTTWTLP
jgi:acyl-ACP thioesterase